MASHRVSDGLTPAPVVRWETAVCAFEPTSLPTRARYRTVRKNGQVSEGILVHRRMGGRAAGSQTVHSALVVLAAHAIRDGNTDLAAQLLRGAQSLEAVFSSRIREYLSDHDVEELPSSPFYRELVKATAAQLSNSPQWRDLLFAEGVLRTVQDDNAHVVGQTHSGDEVGMDLPRELFDRWGLGVGDGVYVFRHLLPTAATLVELFPTADLVIARKRTKRTDAGFGAFMDATFPQRTGPEIARLRGLAASGSIGRRTLRPVG